MTVGVVPSMKATTELVVPRSMPTTFAMVFCFAPDYLVGERSSFSSTAAALLSTLLYVELVLVAEGDVDRLQRALAPHEERDFLSDLHALDGIRHVFGLVNRLMVQLDDDVAGLEADLIGRASRNDVADDDPVLALVAEVVADLRRQRADLHADERMRLRDVRAALD